MVTKYKLLLLSTVFVVHQSALKAAAPAPRPGGAKPRTALQVRLPQTNAPASTAGAGSGDVDGDDDASAPTAATAAAAIAGAKDPKATTGDSKAQEAGKSSPTGSASTLTIAPTLTKALAATPPAPHIPLGAAPSGSAKPATAPVPGNNAGSPTLGSTPPNSATVATVAAVVVAGANTASAAGTVAGAALTVGAAAAGKTSAEAAPEAMTVSKDKRAPHLPYGRSKNWFTSLAHKTVYPKATQLLAELKPIPDTQRFDSANPDTDAQFVSDAAIEAKNGKEYALIIETVPLLAKHANWGRVVNETARHAYRDAMREKKKTHIKQAIDAYNTRMKAAQDAYDKAMAECTAVVKGEFELAQQAHDIMIKTHSVNDEDDSDIDETSEEYAPLAQLAGVKPADLRGVQDGALIVSKPLQIKRKMKILSAPATASAAAK